MTANMRSTSRAHGFTLIELIVTMSLVAILATLAAPMFTDTLASNRTRAAAYSLVSALSYARSEAVKRNATVSVTPTGATWQDGWEIEIGGNTLSTNQPVQQIALAGPLAGVNYLPTGRLQTPGVVQFTISAPATGYTRCVTIDPGGRPKLARGEHHDGSCA